MVATLAFSGADVRLDSESVIVEPAPGTLIKNRLDFVVAGAIDDFDRTRAENGHYWVSLATLTSRNEPDLHWPKFAVKSGQFRGRVSDGGTNPFSGVQPMLILLLRVDDATNQRFDRWLGAGSASGYPGFRPKPGEIVARVPIQFP
jgi:hypothetical protein